MKPISAFYNVMSSANPKWIDSETFAFIGNASGAFQVWQGYTDGRAPVQLSFDENRVWTLGGADINKNVYFGMDTGGDEQEQIYKVDWNTKEVTNLTNNPKARHYIGPSSPDGKYLYFAGNARNPANFDLCRMNLETYEQEIILQNEDNYNNPGSLSPNGRGISSLLAFVINLSICSFSRYIFPRLPIAASYIPSPKKIHLSERGMRTSLNSEKEPL